MNARHIGLCMVWLSGVALAVGCNKDAPAVSESAPALVVESAKGADSGPVQAPPKLSEAKAAAIEFLNALGSRSAVVVERTSIPFRRQMTSTLFFDQEKARGYSDSDSLKYLWNQFHDSLQASIHYESRSTSGNEVVFRGLLDGREPLTFAMRLARESNGWIVTRFYSSYNRLAMPVTSKSSSDLVWARESALDFLESLLGVDRDYALTMAMMTEEFKARLPSPTVHDSSLTYARKDVRNCLNRARVEVLGFSIGAGSMTSGGAAFDGQITSANKPGTFRIALRHDGSDWKVDHFDPNY